MKQRNAALVLASSLLAAPLLAQTTIGGAACNSASLTGAYAISLTGRQVNSSGTFTGVFQANGSATFDGLSGITMTLTANTAQASTAALSWSGTYSVQANCAGAITVTSGGSASMTISLYRTTVTPVTYNFLIAGSDSTYTYSGSGNTQPAACGAATFSGVYTFSATGFAVSGGAVSGAENGTGLLLFDGVGSLTVNVTMAATGAATSSLVLTGTYTLAPGCVGSATLTDGSANAYTMSFSLYNNTPANAAAYTSLARAGTFLVSGNLHAAYGQPAASAAPPGFAGAAPVLATRRRCGHAAWEVRA